MLVVSSEAVAPGDASPAGRCWRLVEELSGGHDVILALPRTTGYTHRRVTVLYYNRRNIRLLAESSDVVFCEPSVLAAHPALAETGRPIITSLEVPAGGLDLPAPPEKRRGLLHYARRFRYHMRTSGLRAMLSYGFMVLRSRLKRKR